MNRNKRNRYKSLILATIKQTHLIFVQEDSKREQLIYPLRGVIQNNQISIREIRETHEIVQNSIFVNRLVFPMKFSQFNRFLSSHDINNWEIVLKLISVWQTT